MARQVELSVKLQKLDQKRQIRYQRDCQRWEFMEQQEQDKDRQMHVRKAKYLLGQRACYGTPYNPINGQPTDYDPRFQKEQQSEQNRLVRSSIRQRQLELASNSEYDLLNGQARTIPQV